MTYSDDELNELLSTPPLPTDQQFTKNFERRLEKENNRRTLVYIGLGFLWGGFAVTTLMFKTESYKEYFYRTLSEFQILGLELFTAIAADLNPLYTLALTIPFFINYFLTNSDFS